MEETKYDIVRKDVHKTSSYAVDVECNFFFLYSEQYEYQDQIENQYQQKEKE